MWYLEDNILGYWTRTWVSGYFETEEEALVAVVKRKFKDPRYDFRAVKDTGEINANTKTALQGKNRPR